MAFVLLPPTDYLERLAIDSNNRWPRFKFAEREMQDFTWRSG